MQNNLEFVTDGSVVYRLGGNDWYAVEQDEDKVMLVDTDCKVANEELKSPWSNGNCCSEDGENGQAILDYCNNLINTYFGSIKHAVVPRNVAAGTGKIESAYIWPMSFKEFASNRSVGDKLIEDANSSVWTRTFSGIYNDVCSAWYGNVDVESLGANYNVNNVFLVAPAFYLKKSAIDHVTEDGEIVLKLAKTDITD